MIVLELDRQLTAANLDVRTAGRPTLVQSAIDTDDLSDRPLRRVSPRSFGEPHPQHLAEVLLERGVVGLRRGNIGLEQHPPVDRQPPSIEGLHLVRHRHVGVQIRVPGPAVAMAEGGGNEASDVDLPDALWPGPGEQGMLLDERQSLLDRSLMGPFDHSRDRRFSDRPQGRDRLHRRERQVIACNRLGSWPRVFCDLSRQLPGIDCLPAMLGQEELPGHLGPHPCPICSRQRRVRRQAGCRVDRRDAPGDLEPERADIAVNDLERSSKTDNILEVACREVRSFQLLLAELGQRVQTAAEQRSHLLGSHRVADGQAVDCVQAGADPHPGRLAAFGVVRRQPGVTFFGRIQRRDLSGQVVISGPGCELVDAHRHTYPKGYMPPGRSGRPELLPTVHRVCGTSDFEISWGVRETGRPRLR
jgi:hypothetical protein